MRKRNKQLPECQNRIMNQYFVNANVAMNILICRNTLFPRNIIICEKQLQINLTNT